MADKFFTDFPAADDAAGSDIFLIYDGNGVKKIRSDALGEALNNIFAVGAGFHNGIYRGKYLGSEVTAEQYAEIAAGTFKGMYIGDYWIINGHTWRIAAFDYWLGFGDTECTTHHIVIVPDENLLVADQSTTHWMNKTDTTAGAYVGSDFYTGNNSNTGKTQCRTKAQSAFGSAHILTHREYLQNAVASGRPSGGAWYDSDIEMMNEIMVYGCPVFGVSNDGSNIPNLYTIGNGQLPLFSLNHKHICNRARWWLRDPVSASYFALVGADGTAHYRSASYTWIGVRPAFGVC